MASPGSTRGPTTLDRQRRASDGASCVRTQEQHQIGELREFDETLVWLGGKDNVPNDFFLREVVRLGLIRYLPFDQRRSYIARANRVTGDRRSRHFQCHALGQTKDP